MARRVRVRGHVRRLGSGRLVAVREHVRNLPTRTLVTATGIAAVLAVVLVALAILLPSGDESTPAAPAATTVPATDPPPEAEPLVEPPAGEALPATRAALTRALRQARLAAGVTRTDAARRAGLATTRMATIEAGRVTPTAKEVDALCEVYRLTPERRNDVMEIQWTIG
ncbi:helix-turn-helix transcriptional regulator [Sphaerisporangium sp. TRM90804]|uniref:helix-turn-helix domain-containing protein n=1 Tax=Sphaerisporangium sp. TRM90804 TaxID=3031113 RepID=UPI00244D1F36|nr:helix-turn-helix transcriptional regulator [Sphaerisporangium sp. TRM90804]MDH2426579.1 helix-turn-helix transcriptional regulator [Sphaerisporangium sp. TRM90804]